VLPGSFEREQLLAGLRIPHLYLTKSTPGRPEPEARRWPSGLKTTLGMPLEAKQFLAGLDIPHLDFNRR
jgi:hypothetical protein